MLAAFSRSFRSAMSEGEGLSVSSSPSSSSSSVPAVAAIVPPPSMTSIEVEQVLNVQGPWANVAPASSMAAAAEPTLTVEVIPGQLYYCELLGTPSSDGSDRNFWFDMERFLFYISFSADFGPVNMAQTYRFYRDMLRITDLLKQRLPDVKIICYTKADDYKRANCVYLITAYMVLHLGLTPEAAIEPFKRTRMTCVPFRDAGGWPSLFDLQIIDILRGLDKAKKIGWVNLETFDVKDYETFEQVDNGDWNWIVPGKFLAFAGPQSNDFTYSEYYVPYFKSMGISTIVRLNNKLYDAKVFSDNGFNHVELYFPDGHNPTDQILNSFLELSRRAPGGVAVHCKAGLGRTGTLICAYMMRYHNFTAAEAIGFSRVCRPGMVVGPQQQYLVELEAKFKGLPVSPLHSPSASPHDIPAFTVVAQPRKGKDGHMTLEKPPVE